MRVRDSRFREESTGVSDLTLPVDTEEKYWHLRLVTKEEDAEKLFAWYEKRGAPVLVFETPYGPIVAAYGTDDDHMNATLETAVYVEECYAGKERVQECLTLYRLIGVANLES